ncbi:sodium- and chloride-dependent GABA transporter ine isoform X3 [Dunckerocampus dactyliophorus]|uniref:sodium- and chloride-dependent GABA transporter ine isoform X3 n=1 Tax=Dunckerocampus dactyliophorus TaxID=161453 RepID=UPI002404BD18|nr:sodium- and chloride-dependent GABA transporter ine isoform X3 [Dunckerocampus dactyliophorus]
MMEAGNSTMNDEKNAALITSGEQVTPRETHVTRPTWSGRIEFILATVGYAVGLGNVWRFPYLCYSSGGGAFLIPYLTMLFLCGIPLLLMEFAIGQFTHLGPVHALAKVCPLLKGVGLATVVISYVFCTYYNVLMSWALFYLVNSFGATPPWKTCNNSWNVFENCSSGFPGNTTHLQSASQQFFDHRLLKKTDGIEDAGGLQWELFGYLFLAWVIVYLCIFKGVKSTGKVVYFTAIFPYFILFALLINNMQLPGAKNGVLYFVTPVWSKLFEVKVWVKAAAQVFNSLGIAFGSMISMASYNKFNNNIVRDALIVSFTNSFTSILAGFVIFSAIGYMAHIHNLPMDKISTDGPGLVFVVYPEVLSTMPAFQLWAPLFFFMLLCLGLDSQFATVEVALTFIKDEFGPQVLRFLKREELLALIVCIVSFLLGLPHVTKGGIYVFQLMDHYTAVVSLMFLAFFEVIAVCWFFGVPRICCIIERMLGKSVNFYFRICWFLLCPLLVLRLTTAMTTTVELDNEDPLPEKQNVADPLVETSTV